MPKNYLGVFWSFSRANKFATEALIMFVKNIKKTPRGMFTLFVNQKYEQQKIHQLLV